eukprot:gene60028-82121_t
MALSGWLIAHFGYTPVFIGYGIMPVIALALVLFGVGRRNREFTSFSPPLPIPEDASRGRAAAECRALADISRAFGRDRGRPPASPVISALIFRVRPLCFAQTHPDLLRSLRITVAEGVMAMPIVTMSLPVNVFMTALVAKAYALPKTTIGLISALPFIANFLQIFAAPFIARWKPPKFVTVTAASCHLVTWIALSLILPWVPRDDPTTAGHVFIAWFLLS